MNRPWYHTTTIYQIYPRSFRDTNGDGIGDLRGMIEKMDYLRDMGFETIWSSPFFASPQRDFGYDVADYLSISPDFGTMDEALQLIDEIHKRGMRIVFDMVMNHTSDEHAWFKESRSSRTNPKADWYLWRDKPNNWNSLTGGSGWHYAPERGQYYWASFLPFQPDLNYHNPEVKRAMFDIVRFWLDKGVDGYRLDIFNVIYKDAKFRDNPLSTKFMQTEYDYSGFFQKAKYNVDQPESAEFARELRSVCDEFGEKMLVGEATARRDTLRKFLGSDINNGLGLMFDFSMLNFKFTAEWFRDLIREIEAAFPEPFMPVYVFSNLDRKRSISRLGDDPRKAKLLALLQFTVRGVPCTYYGEEIGMTDLPMPFATALDPIPHKYKIVPRFIPDAMKFTINRDEVRTPMQWDTTANAGFSSAQRTWLPVHPNHKQVNVADEESDRKSLLNTFRTLIQLRKNRPTLRVGSLTLLDGLPKNILGYSRLLGQEQFIVLMNFGEQEVQFDLEFAECIFKLSDKDEANEKAIRLDGFGGAVVKISL